MCVSEFRRLCEASSFEHGKENLERDLKDRNIEVHLGRGTFYEKGRSYYYRTDKTKLKGLEGYIEQSEKDYQKGVSRKSIKE